MREEKPTHCAYCGEPFVQRRYGVRHYCSHACRVKGYTQGLRVKPGRQLEKICSGCGALFTACCITGDYCSVQCYVAYSDTLHDYREAHRLEHGALTRAWEQAYPAHVKAYKDAYNKAYSKAHRERLNAYARDYYATHKEQWQKYQRKHSDS